MSESTPEHRKMLATAHAGIYRKGTRYIVRWRHKGRMRAKSFRTLTEAVKHKGATVAGDTQPTSHELFPRYAERWLSTYSGRTSKGLSPSTRASYEDTMRRVVCPFFRHTPLDEIDAPMVRDFIAHVAATKLSSDPDKTLSPATVRRYVAVLRACLATASEDGAIKQAPKVRVVVPDDGQRQRKRKRMTPEQTRATSGDARRSCRPCLRARGHRVPDLGGSVGPLG